EECIMSTGARITGLILLILTLLTPLLGWQLYRKALRDEHKQDAMANLLSATSSGDVKAAQSALALGADVNGAPNWGTKPLLHAADNGQTAMVSFLLAKGANIRATDPSHQTALIVAFQNNRWDTVNLLLDRGADANDQDSNQTPLLILAAERGRPGLAKRLVE